MLDTMISSASTNFDTYYAWVDLASRVTDKSEIEITEIIGNKVLSEVREHSDINEICSLGTLFMSHLADYIVENVEKIYRNIIVEVEDDFSEFAMRSSGDYVSVVNMEDFTDFLYVQTGQEEMVSLLDRMSDSLDESSDTEGILGVIARNNSEEIKNYFPVTEKVLSEIEICSKRELTQEIKNAVSTALFIKESIAMYAEKAGLSPEFEIKVDGVAVLLLLKDETLDDIIYIGGLKDEEYEEDDEDVFDKISDYLNQ